MQPPSVPNADNAKSHHIERSFSSLRAKYTLRRGGPRAGPLSVNDPELAVPHDGFNPLLSEGFFALPSPLAPEGVGKEWRVKFRDAVVHVHLLLRAMLAGQDYAGAARSLAVLHRLHGAFDPDVYRYTVALLRLSGDHTVYYEDFIGVCFLGMYFLPEAGESSAFFFVCSNLFFSLGSELQCMLMVPFFARY